MGVLSMGSGKLAVFLVSIPTVLDAILSYGDSKGELMRSNLPFYHPSPPLLQTDSHLLWPTSL